ncbi:MAG TPA: efflux RND transporter periplasmic adaptor subunit [Burkholderiaceae bacterium]|nr:efflux RND transporter periplasmic adaptor subunit [Burkholderiaceae bacterium]
MLSKWLPVRQQVRAVAVSLVFLLAACGDKSQQAGMPEGMKIPVSVIQVQPTTAEIMTELPGRVEAIQDAEIRARVTGIVQEINFRQGSDVQAGQLLFTIDPVQYGAVRDQAAARLQQAQADLQAAESLARRYSDLVKSNAVSRQEYDNAVAAAAQGRAAVAAAEAQLKSAEIDLGYTTVTSPISGRIGKSLVTEGALVSAASATLMASVQQLDRVYVDLTQSTAQLLRLRRALESGELKQSAEGHAVVSVILEDGTEYDHQGELLFSGVSVDPTTAQVSLRAEFDNPDKILLPGMYVRVRLQQGVDENALLVPDQAIQRGADGLNTLMLVSDEGTVQPVAVDTGGKVGTRTIVTKGLQPGDTVIVEGFQKIRPGAPVQPMPWSPQGQPGASPDAAGAPQSADDTVE